MAFDILTAEAQDASRWTALIDKLPVERRDIHFLPEYGRVYRDTYGFEPMLAVYEDEEGYVLQPVVRRPLNKLPFLIGTPNAEDYSDIANPYGYGGPLANAQDAAVGHRLYTRFARQFANWCDEQHVASEFASLHPFMVDNQRELIGDAIATQHEKDVIYIELRQGMDRVLAGINRGHRSSINKARRADVRVEKVEATDKHLEIFNDIYKKTMVRRKAAARWFVPDGYFANCCKHLGNRASLFFAFVGSEVECCYLLIHDFDVVYYHFGGMQNAYPELRVNNLMMYETARWAHQAGYRRYHLGGGVSSRSDDSLLRFKAGFSDLRAPLHTYFCIRNQAVYDRLCALKRAFELATTGAISTSDFVPIYRR